MESVILAVHVVVAVALIGLILIQQGKGADAGASFGGGASGTVFGSQGSSNFLTKTTAILATTFFLTSLFLSYISGRISASRAEQVELSTTVEQIQVDDKPMVPVSGTGSDKPVIPVSGTGSDKPVVPDSGADSDKPVVPVSGTDSDKPVAPAE